MDNKQHTVEPAGAFPYLPPTSADREEFDSLFRLQEPIRLAPAKRVFDVCVALAGVVATSPVLFALYLANLLEGLFVPANRGPFLCSYTSVSRGDEFQKIKIRSVRMDGVTKEKLNDWQSWSSEWDQGSLTNVGAFVKKYYLDELPQLFTVLMGKMSLVGPRPLAVHHYQMDVAQGNVTRRLVKGGLFGASQALKGTAAFGSARPEYDYVTMLLESSDLQIVKNDVGIIAACFQKSLQGGGH